MTVLVNYPLFRSTYVYLAQEFKSMAVQVPHPISDMKDYFPVPNKRLGTNKHVR